MKIDYTKQKQDWVEYLKRPNALFYANIANRAYGEPLKKATGISFYHLLCIYKNGIVTVYRSNAELKKVYNYLIKARSKKIEEWYEKGMKNLDREQKLIASFSQGINKSFICKNYEKTMREVNSIFLYCTIIPTLIIQAIDETTANGVSIKTYTEVMRLFEPFRKTSRNPLHHLVLEYIWKAGARFINHEGWMDLSFLTPDELGEILDGKAELKEAEIEKRKGGCVFYEENGIIIWRYEQDYNELMGITEMETTTNQVYGQVAYPGNKKGKVCIINKPQEMHKCREGDIVVSINSQPALMPVLLKCSAIVTDEGGIACHAAIISRELKKPTIVGTKIATRVFKDGDIVEVNGESGTVRKILE